MICKVWLHWNSIASQQISRCLHPDDCTHGSDVYSHKLGRVTTHQAYPGNLILEYKVARMPSLASFGNIFHVIRTIAFQSLMFVFLNIP